MVGEPVNSGFCTIKQSKRHRFTAARFIDFTSDRELKRVDQHLPHMGPWRSAETFVRPKKGRWRNVSNGLVLVNAIETLSLCCKSALHVAAISSRTMGKGMSIQSASESETCTVHSSSHKLLWCAGLHLTDCHDFIKSSSPCLHQQAELLGAFKKSSWSLKGWSSCCEGRGTAPGRPEADWGLLSLGIRASIESPWDEGVLATDQPGAGDAEILVWGQ